MIQLKICVMLLFAFFIVSVYTTPYINNAGDIVIGDCSDTNGQCCSRENERSIYMLKNKITSYLIDFQSTKANFLLNIETFKNQVFDNQATDNVPLFQNIQTLSDQMLQYQFILANISNNYTANTEYILTSINTTRSLFSNTTQILDQQYAVINESSVQNKQIVLYQISAMNTSLYDFVQPLMTIVAYVQLEIQTMNSTNTQCCNTNKNNLVSLDNNKETIKSSVNTEVSTGNKFISKLTSVFDNLKYFSCKDSSICQLDAAKNVGIYSPFIFNIGGSFVYGDVVYDLANTGYNPGTYSGSLIGPGSTAAIVADLSVFINCANSKACNFNLVSPVGSIVLTPGVYCGSATTFTFNSVVLDGMNLDNPVWIFKIEGTLFFGSGIQITNVINTPNKCNIIWLVGFNSLATVFGYSVNTPGSTYVEGSIFSMYGHSSLGQFTGKVIDFSQLGLGSANTNIRNCLGTISCANNTRPNPIPDSAIIP
jgi:hypothetical protein